jgi:hypothetical protein
MNYKPPLLRDEEGVLWMDVAHLRCLMADASIECDERRSIGIRAYVPYRCVFAAEKLRRELTRSGFRIIRERIEPPRQRGVEAMFQSILVKAEQ